MGQTIKTYEEIGAKREGKHAGGRRQKYVLEARDRELILRLYDGKSSSIDLLVSRLGVPRSRITHWASELGLARRREPRWTSEDISYLEKHLARTSLADIATHLGRTKTSVQVKAKRLGMNKTLQEGYTLRGVCLGLGCDHKRVRHWIAEGWLDASRRHTENTSRDAWFISDKALRNFIRRHPWEVDLRRVDQLWFLDIVFSGSTGNDGLRAIQSPEADELLRRPKRNRGNDGVGAIQ